MVLTRIKFSLDFLSSIIQKKGEEDTFQSIHHQKYGAILRRRIIAALLAAFLLGIVPLEASAVVDIPVKTPIQAVGGKNHTVILYSDGSVAAIGRNSNGQCDVDSWKDIIQIAAGHDHTVGVRSDGTVVATGKNSDGQCNVSSWKNVIQVAAGEAHTLGLRKDGTVVAVGCNNYHQCEVDQWTDIIQISAAMVNSLGLTAENQVIIKGAFTTAENFHLGGWTDVVSIASGTGYFAGVKANSTVVGHGRNTDPEGKGNFSEISVDGWRYITQIAVGRCNAFGLTRDGAVLCSGRNDFGQMDAVRAWSNMKYIGAGVNHVIGIRQDGTLVAAGDNSYEKCDVSQLYPNSNITHLGSIWLNEMPCYALTGKLWTRSNTPTPYNYDTPADAPGCWSDLSTPGHSSGPVRDNMGNQYTYGMHVDGDESRSYSVSFQLLGKYSVFSGVCGYPETVISTQWAPKYTKYFQIYGDGDLLYTSPKMNASTSPVAFEIPIPNVRILTITYPSTDGPNEVATLFDPMVR